MLAHRLAAEAQLEGADPWSRRDGWRLFGGARRRIDLQIGGQARSLVLERLHDGATVMELDGQRLSFEVRTLGADRFDVIVEGQRSTLAVYRQGERFAVFAPQGSTQVIEIDPLLHAADHAGEGGRLTAPMPGKVVSFLAAVGDKVTKGQALAVMEAMKMEHTISAPHDGVVKELLYAAGDQVAEGGELLRLEAAL